jgi:hypothetical protein
MMMSFFFEEWWIFFWTMMMKIFWVLRFVEFRAQRVFSFFFSSFSGAAEPAAAAGAGARAPF